MADTARTQGPAGPKGRGTADLVADVVEIVAANAILAVTAEPGTDIERALGDALDGWGGAPLWLRPDEPGDRTALLRALYEGLELDGPRPRTWADTEDRIGDALRRQQRLIVLPAAGRLRTGALVTLFALWKVPDPFEWPLVLSAEAARLDRLLGRPQLEGLASFIHTRHRLPASG
ncbi:hypothetical protein [Streptomyces sp. NPDC057910]|uniref:hypothetical protein n=1 Tax=Streptomyces sp. NPDC057910 TaxID=3346278 RepID=UPI0036E17FCC